MAKKNLASLMSGIMGDPRDLDKETRRHLASYFQDIIQETIHRNQELV